MTKLLNANFSRMRRSRLFWGIGAGIFILSAMTALQCGSALLDCWRRDIQARVDAYYFTFAPVFIPFCALFISLFLGTEYSDGTIRNKLAVGHKRSSIYMANFLSCFAGCGIYLALWLLGTVFLPLRTGPLEMGPSGFLIYILVALGFTAASAAIFNLIGNLCSSKSSTVVLAVIACVLLMLLASGLNNRLDELPTHGGMAYIDGEFIMQEETPNPLYLSGVPRLICQCLLELLPTGQTILMADAAIDWPLRQIVFSLLLTAAVTGIGIRAFSKKDIR